jgi:hypothetical protein
MWYIYDRYETAKIECWILRTVLLGALLYFHYSYFSVPTKEKRQKSQAKTLQFILSCKNHEVKSVKRQKSNCRAFQTTC